MSQAPLAPLVGVSASRNVQHVHPVHRCGEKYLRAVVDPGGCAPVVLPALGEPGLAEAWAERIDGLLLTAAPPMWSRAATAARRARRARRTTRTATRRRCR